MKDHKRSSNICSKCKYSPWSHRLCTKKTFIYCVNVWFFYFFLCWIFCCSLLNTLFIRCDWNVIQKIFLHYKRNEPVRHVTTFRDFYSLWRIFEEEFVKFSVGLETILLLLMGHLWSVLLLSRFYWPVWVLIVYLRTDDPVIWMFYRFKETDYTQRSNWTVFDIVK